MKYRSCIELIGVEKYGKRRENTHSGHFSETCTGTFCILVIFGQLVPVQVRVVPVQPVLVFPVSTSFCLLAITSSFLIRFERFKWLCKIDFKENKN